MTLDLWNDAHNAIHEIYNTLIHPLKTPISRDTYLNYYSHLEKLLWVSKSYAPHAEALLKYSELKEEVDKVQLQLLSHDAEKASTYPDEVAKVAKASKILTSRIVLAALCIPLNTKVRWPIDCDYCDSSLVRID